MLLGNCVISDKMLVLGDKCCQCPGTRVYICHRITTVHFLTIQHLLSNTKAGLLAWATISNMDEQSKKRVTPTQTHKCPRTGKNNWWQVKGAKHHCLNVSYHSNCTSHTWVLSLQLTPCGFLNLNHVWLRNQIQTFHPVPIWINRLSTSISVFALVDILPVAIERSWHD